MGEEDVRAVNNFKNYLRIQTVPPNHDYGKELCVELFRDGFIMTIESYYYCL